MHSGKWRGLLSTLALVAAFSQGSWGNDTDAAPTEARSCGRKLAPCPSDQVCKPKSDACTDLNRCPGTCVFKNEYPPCGGPKPRACNGSPECMDDPRTPGSCGLACDHPGICVPKNPPLCAGFAGLRCPAGLYCYDKPRDGCDPKKGGRDCIGVCL